MSKKAFRWEYAVLSAILTFCVLSLALYGFERLGVKRPLERTLAGDPDVKGVIFEDRGGSLFLSVTFEGRSDLPVAYSRVFGLLKDKLGDSFDLALDDERNERLDGAYYEIHHLIEEACVLGNFGHMMDSCKKTLGELGLSDYKITVQKDFVFVEMHDEGAYLHCVVPASFKKVAGP